MARLPVLPPGFIPRAFRFLAVGGGSAGVQLGVLAGLERWLGALPAFTVSWLISTGMHYLANRFWALPSARRDTGRQAFEYLGVVALSYLINLAAFQLAHRGLGLGTVWAAFWAIPPSTLVVFLLLNFRVFRSH